MNSNRIGMFQKKKFVHLSLDHVIYYFLFESKRNKVSFYANCEKRIFVFACTIWARLISFGTCTIFL